MSNSVIRNIILLAFISLGGIIIAQIFWVKSTLQYKNENFENNILVTTRNIINQIVVDSKNENVFFKLDQNSKSQFTITLNEPIPLENFEYTINKEFKESNIRSNIEYKVIDFNGLQIKRGYVNMFEESYKPKNFTFPSIVKSIVIKIDKNTNLLIDDDIKLLMFFTLVLVVVLGFFTYTTIIIMRQKQLSQIKTDFVNNMTHEFKTPIATIDLSSEVLLKDDIITKPTKLKHYAKIINEENKRLKAQVESVLQVSQLESKKTYLKPKEIDIHQMIVEICKNFEPRVTNLNGLLQTDLNAIHYEVYADEVHIKNVLFNLLDNAIKYSDKIPELNVSTYSNEKFIAIEIKDNGKGIAKENQKQIFDKFYRISSGNVHDIKGFGLGLFYVKNIVKQHKGFVTLSSVLGEGSTFTIWLPYNK